MAGQADGSIIIDTELDSKGFEAGSEELLSAIQSLTQEIKTLGDSLKALFAGEVKPEIDTSSAESNVVSLDSKTAALENRIANMRAQMQELSETQIPTQEYESLCAEIDKADKKFESLMARQEKMLALNVNENSAQWKSLQYDIERAGEKYRELIALKQQMESSGSAFISGAETEQYSQLEAALSNANARLDEMRSSAQGVRTGVEEASGSARQLSSHSATTASNIGRAAKAAADKLVYGLRAAASHMWRLMTHSRSMNKQFSGLISGVKKFALSLLGARGIYALLRKAVSAYMSENEELKSTLNATWSSIGNILGPIITKLINLVAMATSYVTSFLKLFNWFGNTSKAIDKANDSAKDLKRTLASFDELNILKQDSSSDKDVDDTNTGALPDVTLPDWARTLAEQIKAGDWEAAAKTLTDQLNSMVSNVDWGGIGTKIGRLFNGALTFLATFIKNFNWINLGTSLATLLTKLIENVDWSNLGVLLTAKWAILLQFLVGFFENFSGKTLGDGLHALLTGAINACDWVGLSGRLGAAISKFITDINWKQLGSDIATLFRTALQSLGAFVSMVNWKGIGESVADFLINGPDWKGIFDDLGALIGGLFVGAIDLLSGFLGKVDWEQLAKDIGDWFTELPDKISLSDFGEKFGTLVSNALNGILDFLITLFTEYDWSAIIFNIFDAIGGATEKAIDAIDWKNILGKLCTALVSMLLQLPGMLIGQLGGMISMLGSFFESIGLDSIGGFFKGMGESLKNIGTWLKENLVDPVVAWVKNLFGIHSPSTVFADIGEMLIAGMLSGIKAVWGGITSFFSEKISNIKSSITSKWNEIKSNTSSAWSSIKSTLSSTWSSITSTASSRFSALKSSISSKWNEIKSSASSSWNSIKSTLSSTWSSITSTASSKFSSLKSTISNKGWYGVGQSVCSGIQRGINSGWQWLTNTVSSVAGSLLNTAKRVLGINSPSKMFHDIIGLNIGYGIGEGVEDSEPSILDSVVGIADAISSEMNAGIKPFELTGSKNVVSGLDRVTERLTGIAEVFQNITDMLTSIGGLRVPQIATGTVAPISLRGELLNATQGASGLSTEFEEGVDEQLYDIGDLLRELIAIVKSLDLNIDFDALTEMVTKKQRDNDRNYGGV